MIQVKLYEDKRLQGFDYQGLLPKQIPFVKHYLLSDLQKKRLSLTIICRVFISVNKFNNQVWHLLQQEYSMRAGVVVKLRISPQVTGNVCIHSCSLQQQMVEWEFES